MLNRSRSILLAFTQQLEYQSNFIQTHHRTGNNRNYLVSLQNMKTKQTPRGGSQAHQPGGMAVATFPGRGRGRGDPEEQFADDPEEFADEDLPKVMEDADKPKEGEPSTSKSIGREGEAQTQATEGAPAPPEETPPDPTKATAPTPAPTEPQPGTSTEPTQDPTQVPAQDPTQAPGEVEIKLTQYVKDYRAAGKAWLDTVVEEKEKAYDTLYDRLQQLGIQHITGLDRADKKQVFSCIKDRTGIFLTQDEHILYVVTEEEQQKPKFNLSGEAKEVLRDFYDSVHELCTAQKNFAKCTQVLEEKIEDKTVFLSIIQQVQLPAVQIQVRTMEDTGKLQGKTYRELTLSQHLPNFKKIYSNATDQTRMMAAFIYFVLYEQITSLKESQTGCSKDFKCQGTPFKRLVTEKRQPGGPGRSSDQKGKSSRKLEEVAELEGGTLAKQPRRMTRATTATAPPAQPKPGKGRGRKGRGKSS